PIVRISPYELHVKDPSFFGRLCNRKGQWDKYDWSTNAFGAPLSTICSVKHDPHRQRRAVLNPFFFKAMVDIIRPLVSELCNKVDSFAASRSSQIGTSAAIRIFVRDVSTEFMIEESYHILDAQELNADVDKRLRLELTAARQNSQKPDLSWPVLENMPYLRAVIMKGLRLSPGLATRAQRVAPDRDLVYAGPIIPARTPVGMTTMLIHTDPDLYPDPRHFNPGS
ncbi:cytochrome P450, partial [Apiospora kogelbergensis]